MNEYIKQAAFCRISKGDTKRSDNTRANPFLKTSCNLETYKLPMPRRLCDTTQPED